MDSETQRKPLVTRNGVSKLPLPGTGSRLKPPQNYKRARSPDESVSPGHKKSRSDEPEEGRKAHSSAALTSKLPSSSTIPESRTVSKAVHRTASAGTLKQSATSSSLSSKSGPGATRATAGKRPPHNTRSATTVAAPKPATSAANSTRTGTMRPIQQLAASKMALTVPKTAVAVTGIKKRPAWDLKGRLQDMEAILGQREADSYGLQSQLESYNQRIAQLESQKQQLHGDVAKRSEQAEMVSQMNKDLQEQLREVQNEMESARRKLQQEIEDLNFSKSSLERQNATLDGELTASRTEVAGLKSSVAQLSSSQAKVISELESTKLSLENAFRDIHARDEEICQLKDTLAQREATIEEKTKTINEHEAARRKLHNTIQELKGNIRVFCRVRPLLGEELAHSDGVIHHMNFPDLDGRVMELDRLTEMSMNESTLYNNRRANNKYEFCFDRVFQPEATQEEVFEEISQLVQSALDGYNVCIFAYGQTGSGKTYTMEGGMDAESEGMIPRAVQQIFKTARELQERGWEYTFTASFLEIYNETIGDLLSSGREENVKYEIRMTGKDNIMNVTNLTHVPVTSEGQIAKLLKQASENRAVAATKCNERSSRSHSVFTMRLCGTNHATSETCQGTLNLVDLAGSERLKDSGSEGKRLKETQAINKSLSHLGNVIMALGNKETHIPYRDSKLTYLLQNSLGGNSKTLMFVNVSPREENFSETLNSLRFATKVNQCQIGTAQKRSK